jgi:RHS repeat-associated protein
VGGTTTTVLDAFTQGRLAYQTDGSGNKIASFNYDSSGVPESVDLTTSAGIVRYYYVYNGHGDVVALVDANGTSHATYSYDEFGVPKTSSESFPNNTSNWVNPYRYDGAERVRYDGEDGLYWMSVRAYDPTLGRFISHDPLGRLAKRGWDTQPYIYASNNPLNRTDPSGLFGGRPLHDGDGCAAPSAPGCGGASPPPSAVKRVITGHLIPRRHMTPPITPAHQLNGPGKNNPGKTSNASGNNSSGTGSGGNFKGPKIRLSPNEGIVIPCFATGNVVELRSAPIEEEDTLKFWGVVFCAPAPTPPLFLSLSFTIQFAFVGGDQWFTDGAFGEFSPYQNSCEGCQWLTAPDTEPFKPFVAEIDQEQDGAPIRWRVIGVALVVGPFNWDETSFIMYPSGFYPFAPPPKSSQLL